MHQLASFLLLNNTNPILWDDLKKSLNEITDYNELKFSILFSSMGKKFLGEKFSWNQEQKKFLDTSFPVKLSHLTPIQLARILLLLKAQEKWIKEIILRGDDSEQSICLYALSLLPNNEKYHKIAVNSCRTNSSNVFSSLAHFNPYPKNNFEDKEFYQMVLKTIFMELEFSNIIGLDERYTEFFAKQLLNFYQERIAAGRKLPDDVLKFMKKHKIIN